MIDTLLKSEPILRCFFDEKENDAKIVEKDMKNLVSAKLGPSVATMFFASMVSQSRALTAEEIFDDDENLTKNTPIIRQLSPAKKLQTCDFMITYLKENVEFAMLDKKTFEIQKKQLSIFAKLLDSSTKLLFAQNMTNTTTDSGLSLIELLFDVFEKDLISMLDLSDATRKIIEGK